MQTFKIHHTTVLNLFLASNTFQLAESKNLSKVGFFFLVR